MMRILRPGHSLIQNTLDEEDFAANSGFHLDFDVEVFAAKS